jgi:hypothetical protein
MQEDIPARLKVNRQHLGQDLSATITHDQASRSAQTNNLFNQSSIARIYPAKSRIFQPAQDIKVFLLLFLQKKKTLLFGRKEAKDV